MGRAVDFRREKGRTTSCRTDPVVGPRAGRDGGGPTGAGCQHPQGGCWQDSALRSRLQVQAQPADDDLVGGIGDVDPQV
jgi:hypothetical protein